VEVTDCWEAYTWGHGYTFTVKDICGFDQPIILDAITAAGGITEESSAIFIWPFSSADENPSGSYVYVTKFTYQTGSLVDTGANVGSGNFQVIWHGQGDIREGDIQLTGSVTAFHDNGFEVTGDEDTLIAFKPLPKSLVCDESLP
jgi:hypothetical protein